MLTCFLKPEKTRSIKASIVRFSDRIWIDSEDGDATLLRTFLIAVDKDQDASLASLSMLLPFSITQIKETKDLSATALAPDYIWNARTTGGYEIIDEKDHKIRFDGVFPVQVERDLHITKTQVANSTVLGLSLAEPIAPGGIRLVRFVCKIQNFFEPVDARKKSYISFDMLYFEKAPSREALATLNVDSESDLVVPVYPIRDRKKREGGFDVHLAAFPNMVLSSNDFKPTSAICVQDFNGNTIDGREVMLWRLRNAVPVDQMEKPLPGISIEFSIHVIMNRPVSYPQIESVVKETSDLRVKVLKTILQLKWNRTLAVVALIISIFAIVLIIFSN